jgi:hypothetical protein
MAHEPLVRVTFDYRSGTDAAGIFWVSPASGNEQPYADMNPGESRQQETFAGHQWVVRSRASGRLLARVLATAAAEQTCIIDAASATANEDITAEMDDERPDEAVGRWVGSHGTHRFERARRTDGERRTLWRELDVQGEQAALLQQTMVAADTRWLWWLAGAFSLLAGISSERQYLLLCALSIAGAYKLDSFEVARGLLPEAALSRARDIIGPPGLFLVLVFLLGAVVAAAVPLRQLSLELVNLDTGQQVRLDTKRGSTRAPSLRPGYVNSWVRSAKPPHIVVLACPHLTHRGARRAGARVRRRIRSDAARPHPPGGTPPTPRRVSVRGGRGRLRPLAKVVVNVRLYTQVI